MPRIVKSHNCQNPICTNIASKDNFGNYRRYCSEDCQKLGYKSKHTDLKNSRTKEEKDSILATRIATVQAKYKVDNVSKSKEIKDILKVTTKATAVIRLKATKENNLKKYGVESTNSLQSVKDKKVDSYQKKYGVDHPLKVKSIAALVSDANSKNAPTRLKEAKKTKKEKYGDENYNNRTKYKETCIERFGVENPSQDAAVHDKKMKSEYRNKKFVFPSGKEAMVMGYEGKAITELLKTYCEDNIIVSTSKIPKIKYTGIDNKEHYYFPDIYIPVDNLLIEVKSEYTYSSRTDWLNTNHLKQRYSIAAGYDHKFMIIDKKGNLEKEIRITDVE